MDELLDIINETTSMYKRLFKHTGIIFYVLLVSPLSIFLATAILETSFNKTFINLPFYFISFTPVAICILIFNKRVKTVIKKKYEINPEGFFWNNNSNVLKMKKNEKLHIRKWLENKNWDSSTTLDLLTNEIERQKDLKKVKIPVFPLFVGASAMILLNKYIDYLFQFEGLSFSYIKKLLTSSLLILVPLGFLFIVLKRGVLSVWDAIYNRKYNQLNKMIEILKDIKIENELRDCSI